MLEGLGGFNVESRLGEESEKRGRTHDKAVKKRGVKLGSRAGYAE